MTTESPTKIPWPPTIDWNLLIDERRDPSVPRRFLKQEAWKVLLGSNLATHQDEHGRTAVEIQVYIPNELSGLPEVWLDLMLRPAVRRFLQERIQNEDQSSMLGEIEFVKTEELESKRCEALVSVFRERELQQWLRLYGKGLYFASEIGRPAEDRYAFIEEVFFPTEDFKRASRIYLDDYEQPLLITGVPRAGKTYTALRLLYEVLEDSETRIKFLSWSDPAELLDLAQEAKADGKKLFAVMDDPFGVDEYIDSSARASTDVIRKLLANYPDVRLLVTSREEVFYAARREQTELSSIKFSEIVFTPEEIGKNTRLYPEILERTAWLHGANWRNQLKRFVSSEEDAKGSQDELRDAWQEVLRQSYVPGVLLSAFILYPKIVHLNVQDPAEVRNLALALGRAVDVGSAFRSELDTLLKDASDERVLYLLLPSFTLVQDDTLAAVFAESERVRLGAELSRYFEATGGGDFAVYSYRYKLDVFAEVAQQLLEDEGLTFLEVSILPELERRAGGGTLPAELLADVLTRYFWLGGQIGNQHVITLMQLLKKQSTDSGRLAIGRERDQVYVLGALFQRNEPKLGYDLLVKELTTADPLLVSNVASILDQLLTTQVQERTKLIRRMGRVVGLLHTEYFASKTAEESSLRASLLLHGVLSHLENYFMLAADSGLAPTKEAEKDEEAFRNLLGTSPLMMRIKHHEQDWVLPVLMWMDAIVMKLGELRLYLVEHEVLSGGAGPVTNLPDEVIWQNAACGMLFNRLLDELEQVSAVIHDVASKDEIAVLKGGLSFTLAWHNRWCLAERAADEVNEIVNWVDDGSWWNSGSEERAYWRGISFNLNYHARYFEVKASAWQRESAIYRLHEKAPRLGADTPHESGLPSEALREEWRPRFEAFYKFCLDQLLPYDLSTRFSPEAAATAPASFLLGMRLPREPGLRAEYVSRIKLALTIEDCPWRDHLWRAIVKLCAFNLRESMDIVTKSIASAGPSAAREGRETLLTVIEEVEQQFKRSEARYASKNLEALRRSLDTKGQWT